MAASKIASLKIRIIMDCAGRSNVSEALPAAWPGPRPGILQRPPAPAAAAPGCRSRAGARHRRGRAAAAEARGGTAAGGRAPSLTGPAGRPCRGVTLRLCPGPGRQAESG
jgi:hypothetical protein